MPICSKLTDIKGIVHFFIIGDYPHIKIEECQEEGILYWDILLEGRAGVPTREIEANDPFEINALCKGVSGYDYFSSNQLDQLLLHGKAKR